MSSRGLRRRSDESGSPLKFELWLETEVGDRSQPANRPDRSFCNLTVKMKDGREYALNVWTFDFLPLARKSWPYETAPDEPVEYLVPPDLFVESLERSVLERVISTLLERGEMKEEWLV